MKKKERPGDFLKENLPSNRWELFIDVIKHNWRILLLIGLIALAFTIPLILLNYYFDYIDSSIFQDFQAGKYTEEQYLSYYRLDRILCSACSIPLIGLIGVGLAGIMKIVRRMCFLEPIFFGDDFKSGIKENWLLMFVTGLIIGFLITLNTFMMTFEMNGILKGISLGVSLAFIFPILSIMFCEIPIYKIKFFSGFINAFKLFIKKFFTNILAYILFISPFALIFVSNVILKYGIGVLLIIIIIPIYLVGFFDYCCSVFDSEINKERFPNYYKKGIEGTKEEKPKK